MPPLYEDHTFPHFEVRPAIQEPRFADVANAVPEASPHKLPQRLCSQGISRNFWKQLRLPDETSPRENQDPYTKSESLEICTAVADKAKASPAAKDSSFHGARLDGYDSGQTIELAARDTCNGPVTPPSIPAQSRCQHASQNETFSPESSFSTGRSSLGRPALCAEPRQPSDVSVMKRRPVPNMSQPSSFEVTPIQVNPWSHLPHPSESEMRSLTDHQSRLCHLPHAGEQEPIKRAAGNERYSQGAGLQSKSEYVQLTHSKACLQNAALPKLVIPAHKQSLDESHETDRTMSSTTGSRKNSGSAASWSSSASLGGG